MKNNKGFSLVELIIVIAIMAILVGVMAPQLIKYIEKSKESADAQLCDTVRTAVQTAMLDPDVIQNDPDSVPGITDWTALSSICEGDFGDAVEDALGCSPSQIDDQLKAKKSSAVTVKIGGSGEYANLVSVESCDSIGCGPEFTAAE